MRIRKRKTVPCCDWSIDPGQGRLRLQGRARKPEKRIVAFRMVVPILRLDLPRLASVAYVEMNAKEIGDTVSVTRETVQLDPRPSFRISVSKRAQKLGQEHSCFHNKLSALSPGWGGRDRTSEWRNQNPLPYRLATPQQSGPGHGIDQRDLFRHRRSIEGATLFQQAAGPNFTPKSAPSICPYI